MITIALLRVPSMSSNSFSDCSKSVFESTSVVETLLVRLSICVWRVSPSLTRFVVRSLDCVLHQAENSSRALWASTLILFTGFATAVLPMKEQRQRKPRNRMRISSPMEPYHLSPCHHLRWQIHDHGWPTATQPNTNGGLTGDQRKPSPDFKNWDTVILIKMTTRRQMCPVSPATRPTILVRPLRIPHCIFTRLRSWWPTLEDLIFYD